MNGNLLEITDLSLTRSGYSVLDSISFALDHGRTMGLVGESGAGKSTVVLALIGLIRPPEVGIEGAILFEGEDLVSLPETEWKRIRGNRIAMIFQDAASALNPCFNLGRHLAEPLTRHLGLSKEAARERALELLKRVEIADAERRLRAYPHELSGGMQQRAMIAMALACEPTLLLADEPTSALDVTIQSQIMKLIHEQVQGSDTSVIFVLHDLALASQVCDAIVVLYAGQVCEAGPSETVLRDSRHPYTMALKSCVVHPGTEEVTPLAGASPALEELPPGCRFAPRCPKAQDKCRRTAPALTSNGAHRVACWFPN
jgi:oligopeptide/dipeptide ABC transporter ATP-binding protein